MTDCKDKCWCKKYPKKEMSPTEHMMSLDLFSIRNSIEHLYEGVEKCFEQIECLTDMYKNISISVAGLMDDRVRIKEIFERIELLDMKTSSGGSIEDFVGMNVKNIHERIDQVEQLVYDEKEQFRCNDKKPHKCPVCEGCGLFNISPAFTGPSKCDSCEGKGIVWG